MISYLIKMILCSGILLLAYFLLFEREKTHRFNRFYLLFSIGFSFLVPFISIKNQKEVLPFAETVYVIPENIDNNSGNAYTNNTSPVAVPTKGEDWRPDPLLIVYIMVATGLLLRFAKNLSVLLKRSWTGEKLRYQNARLVLCNNHLIPFSFLNSIFIDKEEYENGKVEKEILQHELAHVKQKHSLDILFTELVLCFAWFNPFLYGYKKAIRLNHEFLADDDVLKTFPNTSSYQYLLLNKISSASHSLLTSSFNYITTKKRLIMMTKTTSLFKLVLKQTVLLPLSVLLVFLFGTKLVAQGKEPGKKASAEKQQKNAEQNDTLGRLKKYFASRSIGYTEQGASQELLTEYQQIVNKYKKSAKPDWKDFQGMSSKDRSRLESIFKQMNIDQQYQQEIGFFKNYPPRPKVVPTKEQFERFKNPKEYGIWINEKRVQNSDLNKYQNTDFSNVFVSKLYRAAKKGRNYNYQVNLMTNDFYKDYYNKTMSHINESSMGAIVHPRNRVGLGMNMID
ncbi:MAG: M56 family metallopeptidase [Flavisolibacter sp.]|nr:M56 family metallopeptidase [Flavisolibacter sp.]